MPQVLSKLVLAPFLKNDLANCSIAGPGRRAETDVKSTNLLARAHTNSYDLLTHSGTSVTRSCALAVCRTSAAAVAAGLPANGKYPVFVGLACQVGCRPTIRCVNFDCASVWSATWVLQLS